MSLTYTRKSSGPKCDPCSTPDVTLPVLEVKLVNLSSLCHITDIGSDSIYTVSQLLQTLNILYDVFGNNFSTCIYRFARKDT